MSDHAAPGAGRPGVIHDLGYRRYDGVRDGTATIARTLFVTGLLAAGLDGIRQQIDPGPPFEGDVGHMTPEEIAAAGFGVLPRTLPEALAALEADDVVAGGLGEVHEHDEPDIDERGDRRGEHTDDDEDDAGGSRRDRRGERGVLRGEAGGERDAGGCRAPAGPRRHR